MSYFTIFWSHLVYFHGHFYLKLPKVIKKAEYLYLMIVHQFPFMTLLYLSLFFAFVMILLSSLLHFVAFIVVLWPSISRLLLWVTIIVVVNWAPVSQEESVAADDRYVFKCWASRNTSQCSTDLGMPSSLMKKVSFL